MLAQIKKIYSYLLFLNTYLFIFILLLTAVSCSTNNTPSYQLTTSSIPAEGGTVNPTSGEYDKGDDVQLQATANENYVFDGWEGDQVGTQNPVTVTMDSDKSINARFVKRQFPLTINVQGEGTVTEAIVQSKITDYDHGTVVELTANSGTGYEFGEWTGDIESAENPVTVTMDGPKEINVIFEIMEFIVTVSAEGPGTVSVEPDKELYEYNETVEFHADPDPENEFLGWFNESGSFEMLEADFEYQITEELDITAFFSSVEDAFVVETESITSSDGTVDMIIFNIYNFLLNDILLTGTDLVDSDGDEAGNLEYDSIITIPARTALELQVTFNGDNKPDQNDIEEWVFVWMFEYQGKDYEKSQEVGEPISPAKVDDSPWQDLILSNSVQLNRY